MIKWEIIQFLIHLQLNSYSRKNNTNIKLNRHVKTSEIYKKHFYLKYLLRNADIFLFIIKITSNIIQLWKAGIVSYLWKVLKFQKNISMVKFR